MSRPPVAGPEFEPKPSPRPRPKHQREAKPWLAHPALSGLIGLSWLLLQQSLALPQLITATVLALLLPRLLHGFLGAGVRLRRPAVVCRFAATVLYDIVVSNLTVARIVLSPRFQPRPAWVHVPYALEQPNAVVLLASVITLTPGTLSCIVDEERREILVHALDCADPVDLVRQIKQRYEQPLMEILG